MTRLIFRRLPLDSFLKGFDSNRFINNIDHSFREASYGYAHFEH